MQNPAAGNTLGGIFVSAAFNSKLSRTKDSASEPDLFAELISRSTATPAASVVLPPPELTPRQPVAESSAQANEPTHRTRHSKRKDRQQRR